MDCKWIDLAEMGLTPAECLSALQQVDFLESELHRLRATLKIESRAASRSAELHIQYLIERNELRAKLEAAEKVTAQLILALKEISKGEGAYSRDELEHAGNCIDNMKAMARAAIDKAKEGE